MSVFRELRRRNVLQVATAYAVVSWLVVQVASILLETFSAPDWAMRAVVILLAVGFPVTLVVAWVFDITPQGIRRTDELPAGERHASVYGARTLNAIIIGLLVAAVLLFALDKFVWRSELRQSAAADQPSVAVLPFVNMSGEPGTEPFTRGIHDDLLTQLSKISAIRTLSRTSVERFRGTELPMREIGETLGATAIVEGGVQRSADRLRINVQLIDTASDSHLWAETFDRRLNAANVFAIQSEIARSIANALSAVLTPSELQELNAIPTESLAAYDAYLLGKQSLDSRETADLQAAVAHFNEAIEHDAGFASAWAGQCEAYLGLYRASNEVDQFDLAQRACLRALALDPSWAEVRLALGTLYRYAGRYDDAEEEVQQVLVALQDPTTRPTELNEKLRSDAHAEMVNILALQGRLLEAEAELNRAIAARPEDWAPYAAGAHFYYRYSDHDDHLEKALEMAERVVELQPKSVSALNNLGTAYHRLGRYDEALDAWRRSLEIEPTRTAYTNAGLLYYYTGRYQEAAEMQQQAAAIAPEDHRVWGRLAEANRFVPDRESAALAAYRQAIPLAEAILQVNDKDWRTRAHLALYYVHARREAESLRAIERALEDSERHGEALYYAALVHQAAGDTEQALEALEQAVERDPAIAPEIATDPDLAMLSGEPRFDRLLAQVRGKEPGDE